MSAAAPALPRAFRLTYPLAFLGAHLAFMPLLVLLLPRRVEASAPESLATSLSLLLLAGGLTASIAHIVAGRWSDGWMARRGSRRVPVAIGLLGLLASYAALAWAGSVPALLAAMILFQLTLNLMFAPLGALLTDYVADGDKARTTAWLALALPLSIAATGLVARLWPRDSDAAFAVTAAAIGLCVAPLLLAWPKAAALVAPRDAPGETAPLPVADFRRAWLARMLVQCGAALVLHYLYVYLGQLPQSAGRPGAISEAASALLAAGAIVGAAATLVAGQLSDRLVRRRAPIALSGLAAGAGLLVLAAEPGWPIIVAGYALFSGGLMAFLSVDSAMVAQLVGRSPRRGQWLGVMNLTNTLPSIIVPALALGAIEVASGSGMIVLILLAAAAALCAAVLVMRIASLR